MNNANTPAMPLSGDAYQDFSGYDGTNKTGYNPECQGLTKREMFAMHAMQGLLSNSGGVVQANCVHGTGFCNSDEVSLAQWSISCADALLKELEK